MKAFEVVAIQTAELGVLVYDCSEQATVNP
jgi:hypothetical protein